MAQSDSATLRVARTVLYLVLALSIAGVLFRSYEVAFKVTAHRIEFLLLFVAFPLIQATVTTLALALLRLRRISGGFLASGLLGYAGVRIAVNAWSQWNRGSGNPFDPWTAGLMILLGAAVVWIAIRLCIEVAAWPLRSDEAADPPSEPPSV